MTETIEPKSRSRVFLFLLTNRLLLTCLTMAWTGFSMLLSKKYSDWMWFARSGSVTAIIGAVLAVRNILRLTREERIRIRNMNIVECFTQSELEDQERDSSATIIGVVLMVAGTLIWAYGDLLPGLWSH
jgi:hypothetical protein